MPNANAALANWKAMSNAATTGVSNASLWQKKFSNANNQKGMRSLQAPQKSKNNTKRNMSAASKLAFRKSRRTRKSRSSRMTRKSRRSRKN